MKHKLLKPEAIRLLKKVQKYLKNHPKKFDQSTGRMECGSPRCIVGWMATFAKLSNSREIAWNGILSWDQFYRLYHASSWPVGSCNLNKTWRDITVRQAIRRIGTFLASDGQK